MFSLFSGMLSGRKTYIVAAAMIVAGGLFQQGYIDEKTFKAIEGMLLGGGLSTLRMGLAKLR